MLIIKHTRQIVVCFHSLDHIVNLCMFSFQVLGNGRVISIARFFIPNRSDNSLQDYSGGLQSYMEQVITSIHESAEYAGRLERNL